MNKLIGNIVKTVIFVSFILLICSQIVFGKDTEKGDRKSGIPGWLKIYMDVGYVYEGKNKIKSRIDYQKLTDIQYFHDEHYDKLEIEGGKIANLSVGVLIFPKIKNIPVYLNFAILNLYEGLQNDYYSDANNKLLCLSVFNEFLHDYNRNESSPLLLFGLGYYKIYHSLLMNISFSYSGNLLGENIYRDYSFSASLSKNYKNFTISLGGDFSKNNSSIFYNIYLYDIGFYDRTIKLDNDIIGAELNISYRYKFINPYITVYKALYSNPEINYLSNIGNSSMNARIGNSEEYKYMIIKTGICISSSNISDYMKNTYKDFSVKSKIRNIFLLGFF